MYVYVNACICVCVSLCVHMFMSTQVCGGQRLMAVIFLNYSLPCWLRQGLSVNYILHIHLDWVVSKSQRVSCFYVYALTSQVHVTTLCILHESSNQKPKPHVCAAKLCQLSHILSFGVSL